MSKVRPNLRPIDYALLIGAPALFFLIAFYGLRKIVGPIPKPSAVQQIKDGKVTTGMTTRQVIDKLGEPKEIDTNADGSETMIYTRTVDDGDLQLEEGIVTLNSSGAVVEAHVAPAPTKPTVQVGS